jgi:uncharacterized membrane protein
MAVIEKSLVILNPVLGGKIRAWLVTLFGVFVLVTQFWPSVAEQGWAGTVTKVYAFAVALIEYLTHGTDVGE